MEFFKNYISVITPIIGFIGVLVGAYLSNSSNNRSLLIQIITKQHDSLRNELANYINLINQTAYLCLITDTKKREEKHGNEEGLIQEKIQQIGFLSIKLSFLLDLDKEHHKQMFDKIVYINGLVITGKMNQNRYDELILSNNQLGTLIQAFFEKERKKLSGLAKRKDWVI